MVTKLETRRQPLLPLLRHPPPTTEVVVPQLEAVLTVKEE